MDYHGLATSSPGGLQMDLLYKAVVLLILVAGNSLSAADEVPEIVTKWLQENESVNSVRGRFTIIQYDDVFHTQSYGRGEFGVLGPKHGFYRYESFDAESEDFKRRRDDDGKEYTLVEREPVHWRWSDDVLHDINDTDQTYNIFQLALLSDIAERPPQPPPFWEQF
ncbi:MAG: hypothetical protein KDA66_10565, partial [Planctomycetaceae bacterium]|nr:hypothetical protein [Planctomycetaceae bacterium]